VPASDPRISTALWLALIYGGFIAYASLYPFTGWSLGPVSLTEWLMLPMPRWRVPFDIWANFLGYVPLGALLYTGAVRSGLRAWRAALLAVAVPMALSYVVEVAQHGLPGRFPSLLDWELNSAGAAAGVVLAFALGLLRLGDGARARWFAQDSGGALALLVVWPASLLFPTPLPMGLGPAWERVREGLLVLLDGVEWAEPLMQALAEIPPPLQRLPALLEALGTTLGLLAPVLLAYAVMPPGWRRLVLAVVLLLAGLGGATASAALNFGPAHALAWVGPLVWPAVAVAALGALVLVGTGRRLAAALVLVAVLLLMVLVAQAPADPYFASSVQAWEHSRYVRFHGLAQWLGWLWPVAAAAWCVGRLVRRPLPTMGP